LREALHKTILGRRCLASCRRLFDFSIEVRDERPITRDGLAEAAEDVLLWVQRELALWRSAEAPPAAVAWELYAAQRWVRLAYCERHTSVEAKRYELAVADGAPLALCIGTSISVDVRRWKRVSRLLGRSGVTTWAPGCRRVIPDVRDSERHFWRVWCDDCAPNRGQTTRKWKSRVWRSSQAWEDDLRRAEQAT
jgi:hypothetical protein